MEILQFAIDMELDGEQYYREQAAKNVNNALQTVFTLLADDEAKHADILRSKQGNKPYVLAAQPELNRQMNLFHGETDYKASVTEMPDQPELYHTAMEKEQQSIDLYTKLKGEATDEDSVALFDFLIGEETNHRTLLEDMYQLVNRPNNWVEAAEFGVREEY